MRELFQPSNAERQRHTEPPFGRLPGDIARPWRFGIAAHIQGEIDRWTPIIRDAGIRVQ
jgi:hypothetical protein